MKKNESKAIGGLARAEKLTPDQRSEIARKGALARHSAPKVLKAIRMGNFKADLGVNAECYVLNDESRTAVLSQRGIGDVLELVGGGGTAFVRVTSGKTLAEYLSPELIKKIQNPIQFHRFNSGPDVGNDAESSGLVYGYSASILIEVCQAIVKANNDGKLKQVQQDLAKRASIILGATANLGIQTLVYKLAGYDATKEQVIAAFKAFVQEEAKKYESEFPVELYLEWARLYGHKPQRSWKDMHLTIDHVYYPLAKSDGKLLLLLRDAKNSIGDKNKKLFQFLNEVGARALRFQLGRVFDIAENSPTREIYEAEIAKRFGGQQGFSFATV